MGVRASVEDGDVVESDRRYREPTHRRLGWSNRVGVAGESGAELVETTSERLATPGEAQGYDD
jgi:hypothetical protein